MSTRFETWDQVHIISRCHNSDHDAMQCYFNSLMLNVKFHSFHHTIFLSAFVYWHQVRIFVINTGTNPHPQRSFITNNAANKCKVQSRRYFNFPAFSNKFNVQVQLGNAFAVIHKHYSLTTPLFWAQLFRRSRRSWSNPSISISHINIRYTHFATSILLVLLQFHLYFILPYILGEWTRFFFHRKWSKHDRSTNILRNALGGDNKMNEWVGGITQLRSYYTLIESIDCVYICIADDD